MPSFDEAWTAAAKSRTGELVSLKLRPLLHAVYSQVVLHPEDLASLKHGLQQLLEFLNSEGRTNANCWATDLFFGLCEGWERDWGDMDLPEEYHDVFAKMSEALHDTVQAPSVAWNFGCLPEQLLEEVGRLRVDLPMSEDTPV